MVEWVFSAGIGNKTTEARLGAETLRAAARILGETFCGRMGRGVEIPNGDVHYTGTVAAQVRRFPGFSLSHL
eukprot:3389461-Pyramimonas_sp.AAC.1